MKTSLHECDWPVRRPVAYSYRSYMFLHFSWCLLRLNLVNFVLSSSWLPATAFI